MPFLSYRGFRHDHPPPVIGAIMNFLIFKVFFRKKANWQLIRDDMILDNKYLSDILTEGKYPERIPLDKLLTGAK